MGPEELGGAWESWVGPGEEATDPHMHTHALQSEYTL